MTAQRLIIGISLALLLQGTVFAWHYRDLLYLRQPVGAIQVDGQQHFVAQATTALSRGKLTRRHLETIATAANRFGRADIEIQALERRLALDPGDVQIKLQLGDALRRGGRFDDAERVYSDILSLNARRP